MFKHAYILYIDSVPHSVEYANECAASCREHGLTPHLVNGYTDMTYVGLCEKYGFRQHPWRLDKSLEDFPGSFDRIASVDAGHIDIWKKIIESGEPGIVLEHKAIVKGPIDVGIDDGDIVHFGPRILNLHDYDYPIDADQALIPVDQWEGVHAYGITPGTAQQLLDYLTKYGYIDSTDPMLAFRNTFDLKMYTVDPPPIVVVNGNRKSTYTPTQVSAFWNSYHSPQFLKNMKPGTQIAPVRQIVAADRSFDKHASTFEHIFKPLESRKNEVLVVNSRAGYEALKIGNRLLYNDDSSMVVLTSSQDAQQARFNLYFCWHYTKVQTAIVDNSSQALRGGVRDPDVRYDVIYYCADGSFENSLADAIICWNLLRDNGILIIHGVDQEVVENLRLVFPSGKTGGVSWLPTTGTSIIHK
jgi:hypothetical protein